MSKKSKNAAKIKRLSMKRSAKESQRRQYESWAQEGKNSLSKRAKLSNQRSKGMTTNRHLVSFCGNYGCIHCFPELNHSSYALKGSCNYRKRFMKHAKT